MFFANQIPKVIDARRPAVWLKLVTDVIRFRFNLRILRRIASMTVRSLFRK